MTPKLLSNEEEKDTLIKNIKAFVDNGFNKIAIQDKLDLRRLALTDRELFFEISDFLDEYFLDYGKQQETVQTVQKQRLTQRNLFSLEGTSLGAIL